MKRKDVLMVLIPLFIFVVAWMSFSIYHAFINSTISESLNTQIQPINPTFDTVTISSLKNRKHISPIYSAGGTDISQTEEEKIASTSATPTPTIERTANNNASSGGVLSQ